MLRVNCWKFEKLIELCLFVALGEVVWDGMGSAGLMVGLDDIKGIFQPQLFYDCLSSRVYSAALRAFAITKHHL